MKLKPVPSVRRATATAAAAASRPGEFEGSLRVGEGDAAVRSDVRGVIDNATTDRLYGWAWDAGYPGARLKVELRLAGEVVANTIADFVRPDLAKNGIGDGCHAFEFPLIPAWIERKDDLTTVAFGVDGTEFPIAMRVRRAEDGGGGGSTQLAKAIESLAEDQASIRAEFAALRDRANQLPEAAAVAAVDAQQQELTRRVGQLELWLTRVDGRLGDAEMRGAGQRSGRLDSWQAALIAVLASVATGVLAVILSRHFLPAVGGG